MMEWMPLHFIRPLWLTLVPLAVILPLLWRHLRRPSGDWSKICDNHLLRWLSVGDAAARRSRLGPWLAGLMWLIAAIALAGPSWQKLPDSSFTSHDARVLVLDLSLSMLAEDLKPNRLTQAHFKLTDMLDATLEGQTGLVSYAGDAFVVSPLTSDTKTIRNMLPALRPDVIPVSGSRPDRALELAANLRCIGVYSLVDPLEVPMEFHRRHPDRFDEGRGVQQDSQRAAFFFRHGAQSRLLLGGLGF